MDYEQAYKELSLAYGNMVEFVTECENALIEYQRVRKEQQKRWRNSTRIESALDKRVVELLEKLEEGL